MGTESMELMNKINRLQIDMQEDMEKAVNETNKSAARRARTTSIKLGKLYKEFRRVSVQEIG